MRKENDLGNDEIGQLVRHIAVPSMLAQFVSVLYSIVDRIYIGHIPVEGTVALAGVGVCGPVVTLVGSFAFLVGIGGAPLFSIRMGEGRRETAGSILTNAFYLLCFFSVAVPLVILPFRAPMLLLFGASKTTLPYAETYFTVYLSGTLFSLLSVGLNQFIICQGFAGAGMRSVILGAALNILLDPLFIFVFHMGVTGAALATVLSQLASCIYVLTFLLGRRPSVRLTFGAISWRHMGRILALGFSPFLIIAVDNIMLIAMNAVLQRSGGVGQGDLLVTCAAIVQSFMLVVTMPLGGISGGTQTILSYNFGAGNFDRVRSAQRCIVLWCVGFTAIMLALSWLAGPLFVRLFTLDANLSRLAVRAIRICTLAIMPLGVQYELVDGFTAIGQVQYALPLSAFRKLVYFVSLFTLPYFFPAEAVFFAEPISDLLGPLATIITHHFGMRRVLRRRGQALQAK